MTVEDIKTFIKLEEELDNLCSTIFYYVKDKYVEQLDFNKYSSYSKYYVTLSGISIEYKDCYGRDNRRNCLPVIPYELLEVDSSWQQYFDDYFKEKIKESKQKAIEDSEYELYMKLKEKYETI